MEAKGWQNAFFSMHHPKNIESVWSKYFVDEIELGHTYSITEKVKMVAKVIYSFEAQKKLRHLLEHFTPDIAHLHCIYHHLSPSILPELAKNGVPIVLTAHDLKIACPAYKMLNRNGICESCKDGNFLNVLKNRCIRESFSASAVITVESLVQQKLNSYKKYLSRVVVPSHFFMEKFIEWGWSRDRFVYIPNYIDASKITPNFEPGNYFLYFGRLAQEKGVATLLQATKQAGIKLKIAGTGPEESALHDLQAELLGDVEFLGFQSGNTLNALIDGARAIVLPSEWYENAPMSVLEAYARGKPVIGARIGGIPELVHEKSTGSLFESGNVTELAALLAQYDRMPNEHLSALGRAAREYVSTTFTAERYSMSMLQLYSDLMNAVKMQQKSV